MSNAASVHGRGFLSKLKGLFGRRPVEVHHVRYVKQDWRAKRDATTAQLRRELGRGQ